MRIQVNTKKRDAPFSLGFEDTFYLFEESHVLIAHIMSMMKIMDIWPSIMINMIRF